MSSTEADISSPSERSGHVCVKYKNKMITWGGFREEEEDDVIREHYVSGNELWTYNLETQRWSKETVQGDYPQSLSGSYAVCSQHFMYLIGGFPSWETWFYRLNLKNKQWTNLKHHIDEDFFPPVDKHVCWSYEDKLILFGGFGPPLRSHVKGEWEADSSSTYWDGFELCMRGWNNALHVYHIKEKKWTQPDAQGDAPCPRASHAGALLGNRGYVFGGRFRDRRRNDMYYLDLDTMTWHDCNSSDDVLKPDGRSWHSLTPVSSTHLLMCGGFNTECEPLDDIWIFNTVTEEWKQMEGRLPNPRLWHTASIGYHLGEVVLFGGCTNNILSNDECTIHTSKVHHIFFVPKSLTRLCYEEIRKNKDLLKRHLIMLPSFLHQKAVQYLGA